jgi:hypothetical protein
VVSKAQALRSTLAQKEPEQKEPAHTNLRKSICAKESVQIEAAKKTREQSCFMRTAPLSFL